MPDIAALSDHIDAIEAGADVGVRVQQLADDRASARLLKAHCWLLALAPLRGTEVELSPGVVLRLDNVLVFEADGALVVQGALFRDGARLPDRRGLDHLWPIIFYDVPAQGTGPFENFRPQVLYHLSDVARMWPAGAADGD